MIILGIETSCDETAAAVVVDGNKTLSSVVSSQVDIHHPYGGVVPELA
ncbi:MAG: tRNA (adenosine(37)-N6)-threonylcarbamoyltransferase complex transferase subunit TsaD, partial [Desulfobacterales bacterium]|nr:tRNA (adenosine(37)-N6)-threonylcarbamoyltransferase complex transferase subunit TsaD [Desulfobacterales bacterium]